MEENNLYCSRELSQMLKDKGFDNPCYACYVYDDIVHYEYSSRNSELIDGVISAPTFEEASKWLRDRNVIPEIGWKWDDNGNPEWEVEVGKIKGKYDCDSNVIYEYYKTYEKAMEKLLIYTLENLI